MKLTLASLAALVAAFAATPAVAGNEHAHHTQVAQVATTDGPMSEGTVRKLDKAAGKVTIAHGPLENLNMPPMTMVFKAADKALLDKVKVGDKVRFIAAKVDGSFTVTALEAAQ